MAIYTVEVRDLLRSLGGATTRGDYVDANQTIADAREKIFDFSYPIFDEEYKPVLETKILKHYFTREIGLETYGLWKLKLDTKMNEIMPYYNQLYESTLREIDPFRDVDYTRDHTGSKTDDADETVNTVTQGSTEGKTTHSNIGTSSGKDTNVSSSTGQSNRTIDGQDTTDGKTTGSDTSESTTNFTDKTTQTGTQGLKETNSNTKKFSDTPQGALTGIASDTYLTNVTMDSGSHNADTTTNNTTNVTDKTTYSGTDKTTGTSHNEGTNHTTDNTNTQDNGTTERTTSGNTTDNGNASSTGSHTDQTDTTRKNLVNTNDQYLEHVVGKVGTQSYTSLLNEWRNTFLNIDMLIINELEVLFMQLWL